MEVQSDFRDLLALFNAHKVDYMIVGAYALAYHGVPRYTGDIDILVHPDSQNAQHILCALEEFGFGTIGLKAGKNGDSALFFLLKIGRCPHFSIFPTPYPQSEEDISQIILLSGKA
ncbi:hypothetical protein AUJ95_06620 [Candidatus Desantisbacteria bacterium CG2_30_40_21]|uniref:Uncharacterized protein n=1 Tax=Candidatus Desantisbacteria bacterium CG2_30_40_21 TaxID=1817895 RepID=A0A1J5DR65_9BACT|nr:MAG: hypothetical protein AUJ95_06620 [Candidatus Desantisbacteria bacterium CG2_30_40_21]